MFHKTGIARLFILFLVFLFLLPVLGTAEGRAAGGMCGENLSWSLSGDGTLEVTGSGAMYDYWSYEIPWYNERSAITKVIISRGVSNISRYAFSHCACLSSVEIADTVASIDQYAFFNCVSLSAVVIPEGVASIGSYAFSSCSALFSVTLPSSLTRIDEYAFLFCENLQEIVIPEGVPAQTFTRCYGERITTFDLPVSVAELGTGVFYDTLIGTAITPSMRVPASVTTIEAEAFNGVSAAFVWISESTSVIESRAFADCENLKYVFFNGWQINAEIADDAFEGCEGLILIGGNPSNDYYQNQLQIYAETQGFEFMPNEQFYGNG